MPEPEPTPPDPFKEQLRARQKTQLYFAMSLFLLYAIALVALPMNRIPLPFRLLGAAVNLVIAAVLWLVVRQKFDRK